MKCGIQRTFFFYAIASFLWTAIPRTIGAAEADTDESGPTIQVMSFNIRYDNPGDGDDAWPHRRDWVGELVRENDVDVLGLQEALESQIDDLQQRLPNYHWYGVGRDDGRQGGEYAPIFFNADRFELVNGGHFWLCEQPTQPGRRDWNAACTRITTWIALRPKNGPSQASDETETETDKVHDDGVSTQKMYFYNTHFDHKSGLARNESAELLRGRIASIRDGPVVLTGDFNCRPGSQPIARLTKKSDDGTAVLSDAFELGKANHVGPLGTWNGFRKVDPDHRIDFVFVSPEWSVVSHQIVDEQRDGRFPSDHCPVVANIKLIGR